MTGDLIELGGRSIFRRNLWVGVHCETSTKHGPVEEEENQ